MQDLGRNGTVSFYNTTIDVRDTLVVNTAITDIATKVTRECLKLSDLLLMHAHSLLVAE